MTLSNEPLPLIQLAKVIRSKNAGPATLTLDLIFAELETFQRATARLDTLTSQVAARFNLEEAQVKVFPYPVARAIKITIPRQYLSGAFGDPDSYGAQQHTLLMDIVL